MPAAPTDEHYRFLKRACKLAQWRTDRELAAIDRDGGKLGLAETDDEPPLVYDGTTFRGLLEDLQSYGYVRSAFNYAGGFWVTESGIAAAKGDRL